MEFDLIELIRQRTAQSRDDVRLGIGDDAAVLAVPAGQELVVAIDRMKAENARLREEARRLRTDPATIEAVARRELGLLKPGELLFIIKDARPAAASRDRQLQ